MTAGRFLVPVWSVNGERRTTANRESSIAIVFGDYELGEGVIAPQDDMGTVLAFLVEADFGECLDAIAARKSGQFTHTATTSVPKCSSGTGRPSSFKAVM